MHSAREGLQSALTALIEPDAAMLRSPPRTTARILLLFCGGNAFGPFNDPEPFTAGEIVSLLLDGVLIVSAGNASSFVPLLRKPEVP
jgi:hypothetical protein